MISMSRRPSLRIADPLLRSAYSLVANAAITAGLGVVFWVVAARLYDPGDVGRDAALIAVMLELSAICQLNMVNAITRFLPSLERGTARALLRAYALSASAAAVRVSASSVRLRKPAVRAARVGGVDGERVIWQALGHWSRCQRNEWYDKTCAGGTVSWQCKCIRRNQRRHQTMRPG